VPSPRQSPPTGKVYRVGWLGNTPNPPLESVAREGLRERGWVEGQNLIVERRYSDGRRETSQGSVTPDRE